MTEIITRKEAKELGLKRYFTGKECKRGHLSERTVAGGHCVECLKQSKKQWEIDNREHCAAWCRQWEIDNREHRAAWHRQWAADNREHCNEKRRQRYHSDLLYKLTHKIRGAVHRACKGETKSKSSFEILGCDAEFFKEYIEKQFHPGMSWENYGSWEYDHIKPLSKGMNISQRMKLSHYSNFQPLWKADNMMKGNRNPSDWLLEF